MAVIQEVAYRVAGSFGASQVGEIRRAYALAKDGANAWLFHPESAGGQGCLEFAQLTGQTHGLEPLYQAAPGLERAYVNLRKKALKFYRKQVKKAGWDIPENLVLQHAPLLSVKKEKALKRGKKASKKVVKKLAKKTKSSKAKKA